MGKKLFGLSVVNGSCPAWMPVMSTAEICPGTCPV